VDVPSFARVNKLSVEEAARDLRYQTLEALADSLKADKIALAHNANDQVETVILFLLRGTGKTGLSGMPPRRDCVVRPMLSSWRDQIEDYVSQQGLAFRTDSSNLKTLFLRNKIRLKLLPLLAKQYNQGIYRHLYNLSLLEHQEDRFLGKEVAKAAKQCVELKAGQTVLNIRKLLGYEDWLQHRLVQAIGDFPFIQVENILELAVKKGRAREIYLPGGMFARNEYGNLIFSRRETSHPGLQVKLLTKFYPKPTGFTINKRKDRAFVDADRVKEPLTVRTRQNGDRFQPFGLSGTKKLKDYLIEQKIPSRQRDLVPVVVDGQGILWLAGLGRIADRVKITAKTKNILEIRILKETK
jgi:tRNA(Ile)-lysidine synthase